MVRGDPADVLAVRRADDGHDLPLQRLQLLQNIRAQLVFDAQNVRLLRQVSWCCVGAGAVCLVSCLYYLPFIAVAIAAGFMALIVRIIKNIFQQAIDMKAELDLTI